MNRKILQANLRILFQSRMIVFLITCWPFLFGLFFRSVFRQTNTLTAGDLSYFLAFANLFTPYLLKRMFHLLSSPLIVRLPHHRWISVISVVSMGAIPNFITAALVGHGWLSCANLFLGGLALFCFSLLFASMTNVALVQGLSAWFLVGSLLFAQYSPWAHVPISPSMTIPIFIGVVLLTLSQLTRPKIQRGIVSKNKSFHSLSWTRDGQLNRNQIKARGLRTFSGKCWTAVLSKVSYSKTIEKGVRALFLITPAFWDWRNWLTVTLIICPGVWVLERFMRGTGAFRLYAFMVTLATAQIIFWNTKPLLQFETLPFSRFSKARIQLLWQMFRAAFAILLAAGFYETSHWVLRGKIPLPISWSFYSGIFVCFLACSEFLVPSDDVVAFLIINSVQILLCCIMVATCPVFSPPFWACTVMIGCLLVFSIKQHYRVFRVYTSPSRPIQTTRAQLPVPWYAGKAKLLMGLFLILAFWGVAAHFSQPYRMHRDLISDSDNQVANGLEIFQALPPAKKEKEIDRLMAVLKSGRYPENVGAAYAFSQIGWRAQRAIPTLVVALHDGSPDVRFHACMAFVHFGSAAASERGAVEQLLHHSPQRYLHALAAAALVAMDKSLSATPEVVKALAGGLGYRDPYTRLQLVEALAALGPAAADAIPVLLPMAAQHSDIQAQTDAVWTLGRIGKPTPEVLNTLEKSLHSGAVTQLNALMALEWLRPASNAILERSSGLLSQLVREHTFDSAIFQSAREGDVQDVQTLLALGAHVNIKDYVTGKTPLMVAAENGQVEMVRLLLAHGADVSLRSGAPGLDPNIRGCLPTMSTGDWAISFFPSLRQWMPRRLDESKTAADYTRAADLSPDTQRTLLSLLG